MAGVLTVYSRSQRRQPEEPAVSSEGPWAQGGAPVLRRAILRTSTDPGSIRHGPDPSHYRVPRPPPVLEVAPPAVAFTAPLDAPAAPSVPVVRPPRVGSFSPALQTPTMMTAAPIPLPSAVADGAPTTVSEVIPQPATAAGLPTSTVAPKAAAGSSAWEAAPDVAFGADAGGSPSAGSAVLGPSPSSSDAAQSFGAASAVVYARARASPDEAGDASFPDSSDGDTFSKASSGVLYQKNASAPSTPITPDAAANPFGGVPASETPSSAPFQAPSRWRQPW